MPDSTTLPRSIRFGTYEVDLRSGELRKSGLKIRLQEQPFQVLAMLLERPGEVVSREEIQKKLWSEDTFVDFEHSLATAVKKLREALGDSAENPRFVETLPRRGYRFIATVAPVYDRRPEDAARRAALQRRWRWAAIALAGVVMVAAVLLALNVGGLRDRLVSFTTGPPKIQSIAVLPLANLSGDPEQEYFADGMTDALIAELGQIGSLRVISRTSVMQYKGVKRSLPQIAKELNVDAVIEGSVLRAGDRVRVTAELIGAVPERHLWARNYERDLRDVLTLQSEIARTIAEEVQAKVTPDVHTRLARARPVNPEAHEAYLHGQYFLTQGTQEALETSREYFRRAIEKDPAYAPAYVGLADVYGLLAHFHYLWPRDAFRELKAAALKALEFDDTLPQVHVQLAYLSRAYDYDQSAAEREYRRAIELNPSFASARGEYAYWLALLGRHQESMAEQKRCDELDPLAAAQGNPGTYFFAGIYDRAAEEADRLLSRKPNCADCHWFRGLIYEQQGMYEEAIREFQKVCELTGKSPLSLVALAHAYALSGKKGEARKLLRELEQRRLQGGYVSSYDLAVAYAGLGEKDHAFQWLDKAYEERGGGLTHLKADPRMRPLRSDPRFQDLLRRMNFPP